MLGLPRRYMNPGELETLVAMVASVMPSRVVETGVNTGRTAAVLLKNVPSIKHYLGIDVLPGYVPSCKVQRNEVPSDPGIYAKADKRFDLLLSLRGTFDLMPSDIGGCDVFFIDGDHSVSGVQHDTMLAMKCVRPRGMIIWHDYHDLGTVGVREVLDALVQVGRKIVHVDGTWFAFERR